MFIAIFSGTVILTSLFVVMMSSMMEETDILNLVLSRKMNGRLDKVAMTNKLMQLKREIHYKCEIGEKNEGYCKGGNDYLNRVFDILDEYWQ